MRITIFGATGGTGTHLLRQALDQGHDVTVAVRSPSRLAVPEHERLRVIEADITDPDAIRPAVEGADAVLSAIGPPRGGGPSTICGDSARSIVAAMRKAGIGRLLLVSAAGLVTDKGDGLLMRYVGKPLILQRLLKNGFTDMRRSEEEVRAGDLEWTIFRPSRLTDKAPTGRYRTAFDISLRHGRTVARGDVAACMLGMIADHSAVRRHVSVAY